MRVFCLLCLMTHAKHVRPPLPSLTHKDIHMLSLPPPYALTNPLKPVIVLFEATVPPLGILTQNTSAVNKPCLLSAADLVLQLLAGCGWCSRNPHALLEQHQRSQPPGLLRGLLLLRLMLWLLLSSAGRVPSPEERLDLLEDVLPHVIITTTQEQHGQPAATSKTISHLARFVSRRHHLVVMTERSRDSPVPWRWAPAPCQAAASRRSTGSPRSGSR